jgi:hypothetical protein
MKIRLTFDPPPIPDRQFDWAAYDEQTYDGPGCPIGYGRTAEEAEADLLEQIAERADEQP